MDRPASAATPCLVRRAGSCVFLGRGVGWGDETQHLAGRWYNRLVSHRARGISVHSLSHRMKPTPPKKRPRLEICQGQVILLC